MATEFGYAGKILRVDLSSGSLTDIPTANYADRFLGGRGIAAKIYWDEVSPDTGALDPENRLLFFTGPITGIAGLGGSRVQVCGKSPVTTPEQFCYASLGGSWPPYLKFAGYDGIVVQGKSDKPVYLFLHDGTCEIRDASHLWGDGAITVRGKLKSELGTATRVLATGPAGENMVVFATLTADDDAAAGGGFGAVMGSKGLKAIAVSGRSQITVANPGKLRELTQYIRELKGLATKQPRKPPANPRMKWEVCWGCIGGCIRVTYKAANGERGKFQCQPATTLYDHFARKYYGESDEIPKYLGHSNDFPFRPFDRKDYAEWHDVSFRAARLCDDYGLDSKAVLSVITWLLRCEQSGILTDENTGIPLSRVGSLEFIETLVQKISFRDGFGDILAQGILKAADLISSETTKQSYDWPFTALQRVTYDPRTYITTGLLEMVEPRPPMVDDHAVSGLVGQWLRWVNHEEDAYMSSDVIRAFAKKFWGSELAADFSTYEGKALAAKIIQDHSYALECLVACNSFLPIMHSKYTESHLGDSSIESKVVSAVTGTEVDENGLCQLGERVFNLQRAILIREGEQGRVTDTLAEFCFTQPLGWDIHNEECLAPGYKGQVISKKGEVIDRAKFEKLKGEYYALRGWDVATGLQTEAKLEELQLEDVREDLRRRGLVR